VFIVSLNSFKLCDVSHLIWTGIIVDLFFVVKGCGLKFAEILEFFFLPLNLCLYYLSIMLLLVIIAKNL